MFPGEYVRRICGYRYPRLGRLANDLFVKVAPRHIGTELFPGIRMTLDMGDLTQRSTYWQGARFEHPTADILASWGSQGGTAFFDMGSNYGFFSYWMLSNFPDMEVYSFEPNPGTIRVLQEAKTRNGLDRLHPVGMGLSDAEDILALHPGIEDSGHSTFGAHPELKGSNIAEVRVAPFDQWRNEVGITLPERPGWVGKLDVEGFELRVLKGMQESLRARAFLGLVVEINPFTLNFTDTRPEEVFQILDDHGYQLMRPFNESETANAFFVPKSA